MAIIRNKDFFIEKDFKEKISWNSDEIKRDLDGNIVPNKEKKNYKMQIALETSCEILLNLKFLEIYEIIPKQFFAICGKNLVEFPYEIEQESFVCQNGKQYAFDKKQNYFNEGVFKKEGKKITGQGDFCFLFKPIISCFFLSLEVKDFYSVIHFEEK